MSGNLFPMSARLAHLDTSPQAVAKRGLMALGFAGVVALGIAVIADAADWPAGAFYTVAALALALMAVFLVPIIEPPRPRQKPEPSQRGAVVGTGKQMIVGIESVPTEDEIETTAHRVQEGYYEVGRGEGKTTGRLIGLGLKGDDVELANEHVIVLCNVALARAGLSYLERMQVPEFTLLLRSMRESGDVWGSSVLATKMNLPSWQALEGCWAVLEQKNWPIMEIAGELGTTVDDVNELRARAFSRVRDELAGIEPLPEGWQRIHRDR
jgi:hypothetical protein